MSIEIKTLLNQAFLKTETGKNLRPLDLILASGRAPGFFTIGHIARVLAFEDDKKGSDLIKEWVEYGMIILKDAEPGRASPRELLVLQAAKAFSHQYHSYPQTLSVLQKMMTGSGLEGYIGQELKFPLPRKSRVALIGDDPWYFDEVMITPERRIK